MFKLNTMLIKLKRLLVALAILSVVDLITSAPNTWPSMKTYDIWDTNMTPVDRQTVVPRSHSDIVDSNLLDRLKPVSERRRKPKGESRREGGLESF